MLTRLLALALICVLVVPGGCRDRSKRSSSPKKIVLMNLANRAEETPPVRHKGNWRDFVTFAGEVDGPRILVDDFLEERKSAWLEPSGIVTIYDEACNKVDSVESLNLRGGDELLVVVRGLSLLYLHKTGGKFLMINGSLVTSCTVYNEFRRKHGRQ